MTPTAQNHLDNVKRNLNSMHRVIDLIPERSRLLDLVNHCKNNLELLEHELNRRLNDSTTN